MLAYGMPGPDRDADGCRSGVTLQPLPCFAGTAVIVQIDLFILMIVLQELGKEIIQCSSFAFHADLDIRFPELLKGSRLVNGRLNRCYRSVAGLVLKPNPKPKGQSLLDRLVQPSVQDIVGVPVQHYDELHPAMHQADIGESCPDFIGVAGRHFPQQIGIDWARTTDAHLLLMLRNGLGVHSQPTRRNRW